MAKLKPGQELTIGELKQTHKLYDENISEWKFLMSAYEGTKSLIKNGYLLRNERESAANYARRKKEASGFDYTRSIVDLFNFYLFKKSVKRVLGALEDDPAWKLFNADCNLYGDGLDDFLTEEGRYSSIQGHVGFMVDKPNKEFESRQEELDANVYPYFVSYHPGAILDWHYDRDENNRPFLAYMKLKDDDGKYRLWWVDKWEMWEEPAVEKPINTPVVSTTPNTKAVKVKQGVNPLGKIPWVWLINIKSKSRPIGMSDVHEVARLDVSILSNISQGEEVIGYGAFPMLRKPSKESRPDGGISDVGEDNVSVQSIMEFDKEHPESKPDWLPAAVKEPIDAILSWVERKVEEIYRVVNAGGMAATEISTQAKSGAALKSEFQLLNSSLVRKAKNLEKAEKDGIKFWLGWQGQEDLYKKVSIERERTYDVEDLASDLENVLTASIIVKSKKFNDRMQKNVVRQMMPAAEDEEISEIDLEIDEYVEPVMEEEPVIE
jgi:hypothetical protein